MSFEFYRYSNYAALVPRLPPLQLVAAGGAYVLTGAPATFSVTDLVAPVLSAPVDTSAGTSTGSGTVTTNEGNGRLYWVVTQSASPPSKAQIKSGTDGSGNPAASRGSQVVSAGGVLTVAGGFTSLSSGTLYYAHYMQEDASLNQSNISSGDGFTTDSGPSTGSPVGLLLAIIV